MSDLSWLNPTPRAIAVYASQPMSPVATQHSLPSRTLPSTWAGLTPAGSHQLAAGAPIPRPVLAPPRRAGRELSGRVARHAEIGGARERVQRSDRRASDAGRVQRRLLRALVPGRQAWRRVGRGPRPVRAGPRGLHAHHARPAARRRDLPPD